MIEVDNLSKSYSGTRAIDGISFRVEKGEILGFLGPNGAGKTTTMRILSGFMPATSGTARVAGFDVFTHPLEVKRRIGYLPEHPPLYHEMRVRDFLTFVARIKGVDSQQREARVQEAMELCSVTEVAGTLIGHLSKGYQQRVGLAQAILHHPEVLILDEPTIGLDPKQIIEVRNLIKGFAGTHTVILSTHILPEVGMTCQRVVIINKGKLVAVDTPGNLTSRLAKGNKVFLEAEGAPSGFRERLERIPGVAQLQVSESNGRIQCYVDCLPAADVRKELASAVVGGGWGLLEMRIVSLSLEEIFLQLTTEEQIS
ncbi:MAG: ATP-binding cassette domain-containing protein [Acidobacteria bacterium]|nr:ATP-binding cassette domain-containing protein [Acidobacteriota bacterium]